MPGARKGGSACFGVLMAPLADEPSAAIPDTTALALAVGPANSTSAIRVAAYTQSKCPSEATPGRADRWIHASWWSCQWRSSGLPSGSSYMYYSMVWVVRQRPTQTWDFESFLSLLLPRSPVGSGHGLRARP